MRLRGAGHFAAGRSDAVSWAKFNQSSWGKLAAILIMGLGVVALWTVATHRQEQVAAKEPLPGAGPGNSCDIWFVGSSTIHRWDNLAGDMAPWQTVKRGVDGAYLSQIAERLSLDPAKVPPRAIVLYAGENDLADGADEDLVLGELQRFMAIKTRLFGALPVIVVSVKPSPERWADRPLQLRYNALAEQLAAKREDLGYVEIGPLLMAGERPGNHYVPDGIHLTPEAYRLWTPVLRAALERRLGPAACGEPSPDRREPVQPFPG